MKKICIVTIFAAFMSVSVSADAGKLHDNAGCGIGTVLFEGAGYTNGGWLMQMLASWTNAILTNTFSMTTGTMGCKGAIDQVVGLEKAYEFVTANMDDLAKDAASGSGETISSLAAILQITDVDSFGRNIQFHFAEIFPDADVQSADVLVKIVEVNS